MLRTIQLLSKNLSLKLSFKKINRGFIETSKMIN